MALKVLTWHLSRDRLYEVLVWNGSHYKEGDRGILKERHGEILYQSPTTEEPGTGRTDEPERSLPLGHLLPLGFTRARSI